VKRPSCKWKGQTDADEASTRSAGSPISRMPQKTKGGLRPTRQPKINPLDVINNKSSVINNKTTTTNSQNSVVNNITSPAIEYWLNELATKSETTKELYLKNFKKFLEFTNKTADELLEQRQENQTSTNPKIQRLIESQLIKFIATKRNEGLSPATLQTYFASVRSFFEIHYYPLRMRRGDYPSGESLGVKAANKENILKAIENKANRNKTTIKAAILFLKDSGLRISDARLFNYGDVKEQLERGDEFIELARITQKQKTIAKPFIGPEAIHALKTYLQEREHGSRRVPPEKLTDKSPLFRTWESTKIQRIPRNSFSSLVRQTFLRINAQHTTAHSLRKYLQTNLEAAGVNTNWIDQILGHKLINSRDAYSKPTDEQLREAYTKAYKFIQVYPELDTPKPQANTTQLETNKPTIPTLQEFQFTVTIEGKEYKS